MSLLKGGKFKPMVNQTEEKTEEVKKTSPLGAKPSPFKKKLGGLNKKKEEPTEINIEEEKKEETTAPTTKSFLSTPKKKLGMKLGAKPEIKKEAEPEQKAEEVKEEVTEKASKPATSKKQLAAKKKEEPTPVEIEEVKEEKVETPKEEPKEEPKAEKEPVKEEKKTTAKKKATSKKKTTETTTAVEIEVPEVDESKRINLEEMDKIMRSVVAPTTDEWEQEKKDVREALKKIKVEQDMTMVQVKSAFSELDDLRYQVSGRFHDVETEYDGTKQNYERVKTLAIAKSKGTNAEARKAEGILACQNFVTPTGEVADLNLYMQFIEEKYKFYQKIVEDIDFKRYSLVNYNNALKQESKGL